MLCLNLDPKDARLSTFPMVQFYLYQISKKQVKSAVKQCFSAVEPLDVCSTNELLFATNKDVLPALQTGNVIYQFSFHCDSRYVGSTSQRLQDRIKQHVPKSIRSCSSQKRLLSARLWKFSTQTNTQSLASDSAIGLHLLQNPTCLNIMMTVDSPFLPKAALLFIYLLLNPLLSKLLTPPSADKKNSCTDLRLCTNDILSLVFFQPIMAWLFPINSRSFSSALHSDNSS